MLEVACNDTEKFRLQINPTADSGAPAAVQSGSLACVPVDGSGDGLNPVAVVENDNTFTVQCDLPDGVNEAAFDFVPSADADLGAGVTTITGETIRLHVTRVQATQLGVSGVGAVPR